MQSNHRICVVIPIFNEENNLELLFKDIKYLSSCYFKNNYDCSFLLIDDCSNDSSFSKLNELLSHEELGNVKLERNQKNIGYAGTIVKGFEIAKGSADFFMILPGDAEVNVKTLTTIPIKSNFDLFFFERKNLGTRPFIRVVISYLYRLIISTIFLKKVEDYNGIFIISKELLNEIIITSDSFFISAEVIIKSKILNKNIQKGLFMLTKKYVYQSTSLSYKQLKLVSKDLLKLVGYKYFNWG